mgnify:CR=1 FL=1
MLIVKLEGDFMAIRSVEYLQSLVRELAKLPDETEWVEFKCNNKQPQMIGEYISALSNSAALCERPKAYLVWGVDDATHKIVGTEFQYRKMKKGNEELEAWLSRMLSPRINFRFFEVPMDEGNVVLMEIPCAEKQPVQFAGGEYIRIGTNKKNLKEYPDKERELWRTFDSTPYELRIAWEIWMRMKWCLYWIILSIMTNLKCQSQEIEIRYWKTCNMKNLLRKMMPVHGISRIWVL